MNSNAALNLKKQQAAIELAKKREIEQIRLARIEAE